MILWKHLIHSWQPGPRLGRPRLGATSSQRSRLHCLRSDSGAAGEGREPKKGRRSHNLDLAERPARAWERDFCGRPWPSGECPAQGPGPATLPLWTRLQASFSSTCKWPWLHMEDW